MTSSSVGSILDTHACRIPLSCLSASSYTYKFYLRIMNLKDIIIPLTPKRLSLGNFCNLIKRSIGASDCYFHLPSLCTLHCWIAYTFSLTRTTQNSFPSSPCSKIKLFPYGTSLTHGSYKITEYTFTVLMKECFTKLQIFGHFSTLSIT